MATVDVGGPFKIETKPYNIAAKVVLAADDKPSPPAPAPKPEAVVAAPEPPEAKPVEPASVTAQAQESPATEKKGANWVILSALIGLGVAAAGFAVFKKNLV
jgi:hypothetical protein